MPFQKRVFTVFAALLALTLVRWGPLDAAPLVPDATVALWGDWGLPEDWSSYRAVSGGVGPAAAVLADGTVAPFRMPFDQESIVRGLSNVVDVGVIMEGGVALLADGRIRPWGLLATQDEDRFHNPFDPATNVVAIAVGGYHALALTADGFVMAAGENWDRQCWPPREASNIVQIAAGYLFSVGLRGDGALVGWGSSFARCRDFPPDLPPMVEVRTSSWQTFARTADGRVRIFGDDIPGGRWAEGITNAVGLAAGGAGAWVLLADGHVRGIAGASAPEWITHARQVVAQGSSAAVVVSGPLITDESGHLLQGRILVPAGTVTRLHLRHSGNPGASIQWNRDGVPTGNAGDVVLTVPGNPTASGIYTVSIPSAEGTWSSQPVELAIGLPYITQAPQDVTVEARTPVTLAGVAESASPLSYSWLADGESLETWNNRTAAFATLPDVTGPQLILGPTQPAMSADYQLIARTLSGSVTSSVARVRIVEAPTQDVVQTEFGSWANLREDAIRRDFAQTFVAGISGKLDRIRVQGGFGEVQLEYPTIFTITDAPEGRPGSTVLGEAIVRHLDPERPVSFASSDVYVEAGKTYALWIRNESLRTGGSFYNLQTSFGDFYPPGQLWVREWPAQEWSVALVFGETPMDLVLTTEIWPGLPALWISTTADRRTVSAGETLQIEAFSGTGFPTGTPVDLLAGGAVVARAETPPYRLSWTAGGAGDVELKAVAGAVESMAIHISVVPTRPDNDDWERARALAGESASDSWSLAGSSWEPGEFGSGEEGSGGSVWWRWTAPRSGKVSILLEPSALEPTVVLYGGTRVQTAVPLAAGPNGLVAEVEAGVTYHIAVESGVEGVHTGILRLAIQDIELVQPRPGQVFTQPASVTIQGRRLSQSRTLQRVEVILDGVVVETLATVPQNLVRIVETPGGHELLLRAVDANNVGTTSESVRFVVRPSHDRYVNATVVTGRHLDIQTSNVGATTETGKPPPNGGEPLYGDNQGGHSIWYQWTAPADGVCVLRGDGLPTGVLLGAYVGTSAASLSEIGANAFAREGDPTVFNAIAGRTYRLMVDGLFGEEGPIRWSLDLLPPQDLFQMRRAITTPGHSEFLDLAGGTLEDTEDRVAPEGSTASWWWSWQAAQNMELTWSAESDGAPLVLGVYQGRKLRFLTSIATSSPAASVARVPFSATAGETYHLALFRIGSQEGRAVVRLIPNTVTLQSPSDGATLRISTPVRIVAAFDVTGESPAQVEFLANGEVIHTHNGLPLIADWQPPQAGNYEIGARIQSASGRRFQSPSVRVLVFAGDDLPPVRLDASPDGGSTFVTDATGTLHLFGLPSGLFGRTNEPIPGVPVAAAWPGGVTRWTGVAASANQWGVPVAWLGALDDAGRLFAGGQTFQPFPEGVTRFEQLCPGWLLTVAIGDDGQAYRFGETRIDLPAGHRWQDVGGGAEFLAALSTDGDFYFLFPGGSPSGSPIPHPGAGERWQHLRVGSQEMYLQDNSRRLYRLKHGGGVGSDLTPRRMVRPDGGDQWAAFRVGMLHTLALTDDGRLFAWGRNWEGQLGTGVGAGDFDTPAAVNFPPGVTAWIAFAAGRAHSMALGNDGALYAWGWNAGGELGLPPSAALFEPTRITTLEGVTGSPSLFSRTPARQLPDGRFQLAFPTLLNRRYQVQYSDDLVEWKTAVGQVLGTGGEVEWVDAGPPQTDSPPNSGAVRMYRIAFAP